jgi:Secretion system C-terminal sorting domain
MKYSLLILTLLMATMSSVAQVTVTITPQDIKSTVNPDSFEIRAKATIKNTSGQTKKFSWTRTISNMTTGWACLVCDKNQCWSAATSSPPDNIELLAGATSNMDVYIRPDKKAGSANVEIKVFEVGNETNTVTGKFSFSTITKIKDVKTDNNISIYPNPAIDYFMISDNPTIDKVVIYNIIGRQMRSFKAVEGTKYYINDFPEGIYIIRLLNANGGTLKTTRFSKNRIKA